MQIREFKSVVSTFSDPGSEILFDGPKVLLSVNGEVIEVSLTTHSGDVIVDEGGVPQPASLWITHRLARLPLLATRLQETVSATNYFVSPAANMLPSLEKRPDDTLIPTTDALNATLDVLNEKSPFETTVLYVTSDAGEGKTSLINQMAKEQAVRFSQNKADWLLVPIPLGGRHFLRFDDITVGVLQNRYRFPALYYDSFLALVQMGVIIPAFDGFEEMFVESSSGEALSAMGILLGHLDSRGTMVIAARKAYFEFENLRSQERLYDTIRGYSVGFGKVELNRWSREQFMLYCSNRHVNQASQIYDRVTQRLGKTHSLITRPVLVRRLVDIATRTDSLDTFLQQIQASGPDFFSVFIRGIVEREANEKWVDRSGEMGVGLLSVDEHCELLAQIALAMWDAKVDYLKQDMLEFVSDVFTEAKRKSAFQTQQIRERIRGHALLIASPNATKSVEFDHEEFRLFFLGEGLADQLKPMNDRARVDVINTLRKGVLPRHSQHAFIKSVERDAVFNQLEVVKFLISVIALDGPTSYAQESCCDLIIRLVSGIDAKNIALSHMVFPPDSLRGRLLTNIIFDACHFDATSLEVTTIQSCRFTNCTFSQLRIYGSTTCVDVSFEDCRVDTVQMADRDYDVWDPQSIKHHLEKLRININPKQTLQTPLEPSAESDQELRDFEKLVRYFMRSTHIGEGVLMMKLGHQAKPFIEQTVDELIRAGALQEVEHRGGEPQRRFKLAMPLKEVNQALNEAQGDFKKFMKICEEGTTH